MDRCPTHPRYSAADCPACEALIERAEEIRDGADFGYDDAAERRYERWLDEIGGSA